MVPVMEGNGGGEVIEFEDGNTLILLASTRISASFAEPRRY